MISIIDKCVKRIRSKVKNYLKYKKSKKVYYNKLIGFLQDGKLSIEEKEELLDIIKEVNLKPNDLLRMHKDACSWFFKQITSDMRINEEEKNNLEELMGFLSYRE